MLRTGIGILSIVKIIAQKRQNQISFSHWTDEKSGNPEKAGRMTFLNLMFCYDLSVVGTLSQRKCTTSGPGTKHFILLLTMSIKELDGRHVVYYIHTVLLFLGNRIVEKVCKRFLE